MKNLLAAALGAIVSATPALGQAVADSGTFVIRRGADTVATEQFSRTDTGLDGMLLIHNETGTVERYRAVVGPDATLPLIEVSIRDGEGAATGGGRLVQMARVIFKEDSAAVDHMSTTGLQTRLFATERGAVPYVNLSFALMEQALRRARAIGPATEMVPFFNLGGGQTMSAKIRRIAGDSLRLTLGTVEFELQIDAAGRLVAAAIPAQQVSVVRVSSH